MTSILKKLTHMLEYRFTVLTNCHTTTSALSARWCWKWQIQLLNLGKPNLVTNCIFLHEWVFGVPTKCFCACQLSGGLWMHIFDEVAKIHMRIDAKNVVIQQKNSIICTKKPSTKFLCCENSLFRECSWSNPHSKLNWMSDFLTKVSIMAHNLTQP